MMNTIFQVMTLAWSLQGGIVPGFHAANSADTVYGVSNALFAEYGFELSYPIFSGNKDDANGIYLGTSLRNIFVHDSAGNQFSPIQDTYTVSGGVRWNELTIGFDHACTHSVDNLVQGSVVSQLLFGSVDRFYVKLAGKL